MRSTWAITQLEPKFTPIDRLMSGTLALDEINEGFDRLHEGKAIRQVVVFQ